MTDQLVVLRSDDGLSFIADGCAALATAVNAIGVAGGRRQQLIDVYAEMVAAYARITRQHRVASTTPLARSSPGLGARRVAAMRSRSSEPRDGCGGSHGRCEHFMVAGGRQLEQHRVDGAQWNGRRGHGGP